MRVEQVVLPQQILAVVVAVRRPHDRVDVLDVGRHRIRRQVPQIRRPVVIELDQDDRDCGCGSRKRFQAPSCRSTRTRSGRGAARTSSIRTRAWPSSMLSTYSATRSSSWRALRLGQLGRAKPGVVEDDVVLPCLGQDVVAGLREAEDGLGALPVGEAVHEGERALLLVSEDRRALVLAGGGRGRLRAGEERRHHHLIAEHEVVDDRRGGRRTAIPTARFADGVPITVR